MPPVNDDIANAITVTVPGTVIGTTLGATPDTSATYPTGLYGEKEVWYRVEVPEATYLRMTCTGEAGFRVYVETHAPLNGASAASIDELDLDNYPNDAWWESGPSGDPQTQRCVLPTGVFYLSVMDWNFAGGEGDFTLEMEYVPISPEDIEYTFDRDTAVAPESEETTFASDPYSVLYLQIARQPQHGQIVDFEVRKAGTTPPGDSYADRAQVGNAAAICTPSNAQFLDFDNNYWNNSKATAEDGEPDHAGFPARKSVWFQWAIPTPGAPYDIWVESDDDDFVLAVYDVASTLAELGPAIAEDDDSGLGNQPLVTVTPTGGPLVIAVDSKGPGGAFVLRARLSSASRPANDDFANAQVLPGTAGSVSGSLVGASYECGTPSAPTTAYPGGTPYLPAIGGDVWYAFVPTGNDYTLTWSSPTGVRLTVYTAFNPLSPQLDQLNLYPGFNSNGGIFDDAGSLTFGVTPGTTYYLRVEQVDTVQDDIDFTWATPPSPTGDQFDDAPTVTVPTTGGQFTWAYDTAGAGEQTGEPKDSPTASARRSIWRKFTVAHDCTYWTLVPSGSTVDMWRGTTLGALDLVAGELVTMNFGSGSQTAFGTRLRKGETYYLRLSNPKTSPPIAGTMQVIVEYETDDPWTDGDGWDSETGSPGDWTDGVLTFSEAGYRTVNPWLSGTSSRYPFISFDVRLESEWSTAAADGPVLGRQPGPTTHYPYAGNRITVMRLHLGTGALPPNNGSTVIALDIVGDRDGNSWLETWNEIGGGNAINNRIWTDFAVPNAQTEGGEWIHVDITPIGVYVQGRLALEITITKITDIDWGAVRFPTREGWDPTDDPPETWTLQLQNMRATDRVVNGAPLDKGPMISEFDTRLFHTPTYVPTFGGPSPLYPRPAYLLLRNSSLVNPATLEAENPSANVNHQWDAVRMFDESYCWQIPQHDNAQRHCGFWVTFDAFPGAGQSVVVGALRQWSGTQWGYYSDLCRLEVNDLGELWIYPYRFFQRPGMPGYVVYGSPLDPLTFQPKIPEPRAQKIGQMVLNQAYWIEIMVDATFLWDAVMRVAVNEVECFAQYRAAVNQTDDSRISAGRYGGTAYAIHRYAELAVGTSAGTPSGPNNGYYSGDVDLYAGPWFVGRGGLYKYAQRNLPPVLPTVPDDPAALLDLDLTEPLPSPGIGAHAGAVIPAATRTGTHRIPVASTLDKFETTPAAMASETDGFFEYQGVRFYKGSQSEDVSLNPDLSLGTTGYAEYGWGAQPALPPVVVADGSGPVGPFGDDYTGESALEWAHDPSGPGSSDYAKFGQNWDYVYFGVTPPTGVREGGDPNDDGGHHFLAFLWCRRVGGATFARLDAMYGVRGDIAAGPSWDFNDELWHWVWGNSYPNYDYSGGTDAFGAWQFEFTDAASKFHMKRIHVFKNAHTYPRFKVTTDNGASSFWLLTPTEAVHTYLSDDPNDNTWNAGIFMDNVCPFERFDRTGPNVPGLLGNPPTGISMGDYRPRRYVEVKPPTEPDLEDMNVFPSALKVVVKGAGFGVGAEFGDVSTARANGTLKVRMTHGTVRHVVCDFPMTTTDRIVQSQVIPRTPSGFSWQSDRVAELTTRMGFHFNYHDKSVNDSYGYRILQSGSAICKSLVYEAFAEVPPGPPICTVGARWKSRLTRRI